MSAKFSHLIMHDETTLFCFIEKLHRLCFEPFSHFQNIDETYYSFVKLFLLENGMILTKLQFKETLQNCYKSSKDGF